MEELIEKFDVNRMMPGHTNTELIELMNKIYGEELSKKQIVAFEFEYLFSDSDIFFERVFRCINHNRSKSCIYCFFTNFK